MKLHQDIYLQNSCDTQPIKPQILYLFRDSQQSTLQDSDWLFSVFNLKKLIGKVVDTKIKAIEVGGGRYFEIILLKGRNPFYILRKIHHAIFTHADYDSTNKLQMQVLVRGRNGMGFNPVDETVQEALIDEHQKVGVTIFRNFHALNDIHNIYISPNATHMQGALAYTTDPADVSNPIYDVNYYVNYANLLIKQGVHSLCIKDMAGQLTSEMLIKIVSGIKKLHVEIPITLHMHSSNNELARRTIATAIDIPIDGVEFALSPLAGAASHLDINEFVQNEEFSDRVQLLDIDKLNDLTEFSEQLFEKCQRVDLKISSKIRAKMSAFGVPGGALPSVLALLTSQFPEKFVDILSEDFELFIGQYLSVLTKVREDAGRPPLVTPSADIVCRQAVFCLSKTRNCSDLYAVPVNEFYSTLTPDYCRLILGHFGFVYRYGDVQTKNGEYLINKPLDELIEICAKKEYEGNVYVNFWTAGKNGTPLNPAFRDDLPKFDFFLHKVNDYMLSLANRLETQGYSKSKSLFIAQSLINRFATKNQLALMLAMLPKGKDEEFIWQKVLFADFSNDIVEEEIPFNDDELKEVIEHLAQANSVPGAWQSRSIDLVVFFSMTNKFLDEEKAKYENLSKLILQKSQLQAEIRMQQLTNNHASSWLQKFDEVEQKYGDGLTFNTTSKKIRLLKDQLTQTERNITKYQESKDILNLKDNTLGLEFLNTYVYSAVRHMLLKIKVI